jgi:hypothetical protein
MSVNEFSNVRAAKDYLAGKITEQAEREGAPLTEVERKMLYFSETGWTLPDMMKLSEEFDREYDQDEYEEKIGGLVGRLLASEDEQGVRSWDDAVAKIGDEDHYLLVLIGNSSMPQRELPAFLRRLGPWLPQFSQRNTRPAGDIARLIFMGGVIPILIFVCMVLFDRIFGPDWYDNLTHFLR